MMTASLPALRRSLAAGALVAAAAGLGWTSLSPQPVTAQASAAAAQAWTVDPARSTIGFATGWAGQQVTGSFASWTADIRFDPANLAGSRAVVTVQTGSARANLAEANDNLPLPDWLNARAFPTARWESTAFRRTGEGQYVADGFLTLKGQRYRLALPFALTVSGNVATMSSNVGLDRIAVRVGVDSDGSAEWVDRTTSLAIRVRATRR
jgi:polyisoprenoid-binding protein YceI